MAIEKIFKAEVRCDFPEWWRYNVFMTLACFDKEGRISDYLTLSDKVYEPGDGTEVRQMPEGYDPARPLMLQTPPCDHTDVYVYVIANTFPASAVIKEWPPFDIELLTSTHGSKPETIVYKVNQWGGLTLRHTLG